MARKCTWLAILKIHCIYILNICVACVYICYKQVNTKVLFPKPWPKESYIMFFFLLDVLNLQPRIVIELNILSYNTLKPSTNSLNFLYLHLHVTTACYKINEWIWSRGYSVKVWTNPPDKFKLIKFKW